ncbi:hypothetical protein J2S15_003248 [Breznakia pachnodae]|uniref:Uncharacterized protein n=1 Tax=Breznakia pachnodae TaxID=265178 RepID=A0ABU0E711_9FIRM|nr:hypothetical protein [Breznakia pachnodae]
MIRMITINDILTPEMKIICCGSIPGVLALCMVTYTEEEDTWKSIVFIIVMSIIVFPTFIYTLEYLLKKLLL